VGAHITKLEDGSVRIAVDNTGYEEYDPAEGRTHSVAIVSAEEWAKLSKFKDYEAPAVEVITENLAPEPVTPTDEGDVAEETTDGDEG